MSYPSVRDFAARLRDEAATQRLGEALAGALVEVASGLPAKRIAEPARLLVTLRGPLGAGKSALVRAALHALGWRGRVPSPTYTLVETYAIEPPPLARRVFEAAHLDLYRLADPEELDALAAREVLDGCDAVFVEWPERGAGWLPPATLAVELDHAGDGRRARLVAGPDAGEALLDTVQARFTLLETNSNS